MPDTTLDQPHRGPVGGTLLSVPGGKRCRLCHKTFKAGGREPDYVGIFPTNYGHEKGLYNDGATLRHDCKKSRTAH